MGAAACTDGSVHSWWGEFEKKGFLGSFTKGKNVFFFTKFDDHIEINSKDNGF
jgi:hypothetical protein